jgi:hypothetical protein
LPILVVFLKLFAAGPLQAALYTSLAYVFATVPVFMIRYRIAKRSLPFSFPFKNLTHYVFAAVLMVIFLSQINLAATLSRIMILVLAGSAVYFGTVLIIDSETRVLAKSIMDFISEKLGHGRLKSQQKN